MSAGVKNGSVLFSTAAPVHTHIEMGHGVSREVLDLRSDIAKIFGAVSAITVDEYTTPAAASNNAIKTSFATATTAQVFTGTALNGSVGGTKMPIGRNITVTAAANAGGYAASLTVKGYFQGVAQTDTITITASSTTSSTKPFDTVTEIDLPACPDALGSLQVGFGAALACSRTPLSRAGGVLPFREILDGAVAGTAGTVTAAGLYTPNTAPNGTHNFAVYYEADASKISSSSGQPSDPNVYGKPGTTGVGSPNQ